MGNDFIFVSVGWVSHVRSNQIQARDSLSDCRECSVLCGNLSIVSLGLNRLAMGAIR